MITKEIVDALDDYERLKKENEELKTQLNMLKSACRTVTEFAMGCFDNPKIYPSGGIKLT